MVHSPKRSWTSAYDSRTVSYDGFSLASREITSSKCALLSIVVPKISTNCVT